MRRLLLVSAFALLAACAEKPTPAPPPQAPAAPKAAQPRPRVVRPPLSPAGYVETVGSIDLFEIRSAELALSRSADPRVRSIAQTILRDHSGSAAQLSLQGRRLNLLPGAELIPVHQALFTELYNSGDFDSTYRRQQLAIHHQSLGIQTAFSARGTSPTLRQLAIRLAPLERGHLAMLRRAS